jgi:hypothetical protein
MSRCSWYAVAAAATLALGACSERDPDSTTGPQFANTDPCGFSNSLVINYFPSSRQSSIITLKQSMANAGHGTSAARTFGFQIMDSIGSVSRSFSVSPSAGAQLTVALIGCMFDNASTFTYPHQTDPVYDFTQALTNATGGAYYVRGGGAGGVDPDGDADGRSKTVIGRIVPLSGPDDNLSAIAPSSDGSWTTMLSGSGASEGRALIYGYPVTTTPLLFEWATVPSELTFSPPAVVSVCDNDVSSSAMVHEEAVGVLAFVNSSICNDTQSQTMIETGWGPKALAARLGRVLVSAVVPAPLLATAVDLGSGGKTSTIPKSKFGKTSVTSVTVGPWKDDPGIPSTWNGTSKAQARAASAYVSADGQAVRFCAYLIGENNNGTPTQLMKDPGPQQDPECTTPPGGNPNALSVVTQFVNNESSVADFGKVWVTKTGTITITLTVVSGKAVNGSLSTQAYVKPAKK